MSKQLIAAAMLATFIASTGFAVIAQADDSTSQSDDQGKKKKKKKSGSGSGE